MHERGSISAAAVSHLPPTQLLIRHMRGRPASNYKYDHQGPLFIILALQYQPLMAHVVNSAFQTIGAAAGLLEGSKNAVLDTSKDLWKASTTAVQAHLTHGTQSLMHKLPWPVRTSPPGSDAQRGPGTPEPQLHVSCSSSLQVRDSRWCPPEGSAPCQAECIAGQSACCA
jgi:hypothetical protein